MTRKDRSNGKAACDATVNDCDNKKGNINFIEFQRNVLKRAPRCINVLNKNTDRERDCPNDAHVSHRSTYTCINVGCTIVS